MGRQLYRITLYSILTYLVLSIPDSAVAASQPSGKQEVYFCGGNNFQLDKPYSYQFPNRRYTRTSAANLNVGEPRTVRMIYFLPNDWQYRAGVVQKMKEEIRAAQTFYAEQMTAHGYGAVTFRVETDPQGDPMVHRVDGQHPFSHYDNTLGYAVIGEIEQVFDLDANIYFIVLGTDALRQSDGAPAGGVGDRRSKNGGWALVANEFSRYLVAHELGHAFGLQHDFRDGAYIMSYGPGHNRLSACAAEFLEVHPYFNPQTPIEEGPVPIIELISPQTYLAGTRNIPIQFKVNDPEGLHQAILCVFYEVKACRRLMGEKDAIIEFDYDGFIPSDDSTNLYNPVVHLTQAFIVDRNGNLERLEFGFSERSRQLIAALQHRFPVYSVAFSKDGESLACGTLGAVKVWKMATRQFVNTLEHDHWVRSLSFSPTQLPILASGSEDNTVRLWNVVTTEEIATLEGHTGVVFSVSFSPDGSMLASASWDSTVKLWDVVAQEEITTLEGHRSGAIAVSFSSAGTMLASGSDSGEIKLWDAATRENIATRSGHRGSVHSVSFSPDGKILASGSTDKSIKLWDVPTLVEIGTLKGHTHWVEGVSFSPDGAILASGAHNAIAMLWDASEWTGKTTEIALPDPNLRAAIATTLGQPSSAPIFRRTMAALTDFDASSASISDLTGLDLAINLRVLNLENNNISDLAPLVANMGLNDGDEVNVRRNSLSYPSIYTHIPVLQRRGVEVIFDHRTPQRIRIVSGDDQKGIPGETLANPFVVEVRDKIGVAFEGVPIMFAVTSGGGTLSATSAATDSNGRAESTLTLGSTPGTNTVRVSVEGNTQAVASLTIETVRMPMFTLYIPAGTHAIHIPLAANQINGEDGTIETVGDVYNALGDAVNLIITVGADGNWMSYLGDESTGSMADAVIDDDTGLIAVMSSAAKLELMGDALGTGGDSRIDISLGNNLVGVPLNPENMSTISDLLVEGVGAIAVPKADGEGFNTISKNNLAADGPLMGGVGYIVVATAETSIPVMGSAWENEGAAAAPAAAFSGTQTPVLHVDGGIMDEFDMLARIPELRVTVKNLSTGASLDTVVGTEASAKAYSGTFVELSRHAAKAGDVLEIIAHSPSPLVGVRPVPQVVVSAEEVLTSRIELPDLELYEIPSETQLLSNYPNPFNPETWIPYRLAQAAKVTLEIYDTNGRTVRSIDVGFKPAAVYESRASAIY